MSFAREALKHNPPTIVKSLEEIGEKLLSDDDNYVYSGIIKGYALLRQRKYCDLIAVKSTSSLATPLHFMLTKGSPYTNMLNEAMGRHEKFIWNRQSYYFNLNWRQKLCSDLDEKKEDCPNCLKIVNVGGVFAFLLIGCLVAVLICLVEICLKSVVQFVAKNLIDKQCVCQGNTEV